MTIHLLVLLDKNLITNYRLKGVSINRLDILFFSFKDIQNYIKVVYIQKTNKILKTFKLKSSKLLI